METALNGDKGMEGTSEGEGGKARMTFTLDGDVREAIIGARLKRGVQGVRAGG